MKADGVEYEERMERLQDVSYPKPMEELLFHAYNTYRKSHPWVGDHPLSPKSVIRDMYERAMSFTEFVSFYELARTEGIVLRYLASAYKALEHTVPDDLKSEDLEDLIAWLGELVRQVDSSLLDEWEQLANPEVMTAEEAQEKADQVKPVTANARAFRVLVRNAMFRRVELAALDNVHELGALDADSQAGTPTPGVRRWTSTGTSTRTSAPAPTPAVPSCCPSWRSRRTACGASVRPSPTRTATTTGASARRSTSRRPTRRAVPSSRSPTSASCEHRRIPA